MAAAAFVFGFATAMFAAALGLPAWTLLGVAVMVMARWLLTSRPGRW